jgi:hypothetical protein
MSYLAYIIQRKPKTPRLFVELEKSTEKFYLTREDAEADRQRDPVLTEFFAVYEVEVEFTYAQIEAIKTRPLEP